MSQYVGKKISLISAKGIRYVGTLRDVDGEEATVTLCNVKQFGTEGRNSVEVPASKDVYPVVVFRGSDVVDLSVLEDEPEDEEEGAKVQQQEEQREEQHPIEPQQSVSQEQRRPAAQQKVYEQPQQREQRPSRQYNNRRPQFDTTDINKEFDFESNNARFDELRGQTEQETTEESKEEEPEEPAYNKQKSFFDNISTSTKAESPNNVNNSFRFNNNNNNYNRRGNYRGRGRGKGRGRGGYNDSNTPAWA